jgi:hypothetical protein
VRLNTSESHALDFFRFCRRQIFLDEVNTIREHIFANMYVKNSELFRYTENRRFIENVERQKITIQSLYLQTLKLIIYIYLWAI